VNSSRARAGCRNLYRDHLRPSSSFGYSSIALTILVSLLMAGCQFPFGQHGLPHADQVELDQLIVHTNFKLPQHHRLLEQLTALRGDIAEQLQVKPSDEPIHVYLFDDDAHYRTFMENEHPQLPYRRAFFVKNDTTLNVYAFWGEKVGEDLRHEVTHGYLHSVMSNLPLWLDEGLAEYYEVPRGRHGYNWAHIELLITQLNDGKWQPDLERLERIVYPHELTQIDYAESWLWTHFMLESQPYRQEYLRGFIHDVNEKRECNPLSKTVAQFDANANQELIAYLRQLHSLQQ
jgi:hypothetical protein